MSRRFGVWIAALALGAAIPGASVASAKHPSNQFHRRWQNVTEVCGGVALDPAPVRASGTWSLALERDGSGTFTFDYHDVRDVNISGEVPVSTLTKKPLVVSGLFSIADFAMTMTVHDNDVVLVSTTQIPCDGTGHTLSPIFVGAVR